MAKRWQNIKHRCMNNNKMVLFIFYAAATLNWCVYNRVLPLFPRPHKKIPSLLRTNYINKECF